MRKFFLLLLVGFVFALSCPRVIWAQSNFTTGADVTYVVSESGITHVSYRVTLTNTSDTYYASVYNILLGFDTIKNLNASDSSGSIAPGISRQDNGEEVSIPFRNHIIGINKTHTFSLSFDTPDVAHKRGQVWEIMIPGLENQADFTVFNVKVVVPSSFGKPSYVKPEISGEDLSFTKENLHKGGIAMGFGKTQLYQMQLTYHLQNTNLFPIKTEIALPPTTNYQDISLDNINPKPASINIDKDGNWLASYTIMPSQKTNVSVKESATVYSSGKTESLSSNDYVLYTRPLKYWDSTESDIQKLAKDLRSPDSIYQYVVNKLKYDYSRVSSKQERLGAAKALLNPQSAVCLEFTDLFVALARGAGIPARGVEGYAYTDNARTRPLSLIKDVLHAWPEYYDKNRGAWIMVDPTWGNTTGGIDYFHAFDFDHIAFVIKGVNSDYPVSAGGYKLPGMEGVRDVDVQFATVAPDMASKYTMTVSAPDTGLSGFSIVGNVTLNNIGNTLLPVKSIIVSSQDLSPKFITLNSEAIAPGGVTSIPFSFRSTSFLTYKRSSIIIRDGNQTYVRSIRIYPFIPEKYLLICGAVAVTILILFVIAQAARRLSVFRQK